MDKNMAKDATTKNATIEGSETVTQVKVPTYEKDEDWVKNYISQFGTEPSFF